MKKLSLLLTAVLLMIGLMACKEKEEEPKVEATTQDVMMAIQEELAKKNDIEVVDGKLEGYKLMNIFDSKQTADSTVIEHFDLEGVKSGYILEPMKSMIEAELIIVIEAKDNEAADELDKAFHKILSDQDQVWKDYLKDQYQLVKSNQMSRHGDFLLYATTKDVDNVVDVFSKRLNS